MGGMPAEQGGNLLEKEAEKKGKGIEETAKSGSTLKKG